MAVNFDEALNEYIRWAMLVKRHAEPTINVRRPCLQRFRAFMATSLALPESELTLDSFNRVNIEKWIAADTAGNGSACVDGAIDATRSFGVFCVERAWLSASPAHEIKKPTSDPPRRDKVSDTEVAKIFFWATRLKDPYTSALYPALLASMVLAGLRANEALNLRLSDVDADAGTIHVRCGKGKKPRTIAPAPQFWQFYAAWKKFRATIAPAHDYLWLTKVRGGAASKARLAYGDAFRRIMRECSDAVGMNDGRKITAHCYRHNFAINLWRNGATLKSIGEMLGHSNEEVTFRYLRDDLECGQAGRVYGSRPELTGMAATLDTEATSDVLPVSPPEKQIKRRKRHQLETIYELPDGVYTTVPPAQAATTVVAPECSRKSTPPQPVQAATKSGAANTKPDKPDARLAAQPAAPVPPAQVTTKKRHGPKPKADVPGEADLDFGGWSDFI